MECRDTDNICNGLDKIIIAQTLSYLTETNTHRDTFCKRSLFDELKKSNALVNEPETAKEFDKWQSAQCKRIERIMLATTSFPQNFVFPWVAALPDPYKTKCMHEICGSLGSHYMPLSPVSGVSDLKQTQARLTDISKEFSDVLQYSAPAMDGAYDVNDSKDDLQRLSNELFELIASTFVEIDAIHKASGVLPSAYVAMSNSPLFKK